MCLAVPPPVTVTSVKGFRVKPAFAVTKNVPPGATTLSTTALCLTTLSIMSFILTLNKISFILTLWMMTLNVRME
jgi:hypothetical protein